MRNLVMLTVALSSSLGLVGCAAMKGPPGPKLYDNVVFITKTDSVLLLPPTLDKEFVSVVRSRLHDTSKRELTNYGDLKNVDDCAPRTLKITQDITGITVSGETYSAGSIFRPAVTTTKKDDVRVSNDVIVQDCVTGKTLESFSYYTNGLDPTDVIRWLSQANVSYVYNHQHGPRERN
jgi:hypothetical protein